MILEVNVTEEIPIVGMSPTEARQQNHLPADVVTLTIERDGEIMQPADGVPVAPGDLVTVLPNESPSKEAVAPFIQEPREHT